MDNQLILESLINMIPHYIFWKDRNGMFQGCNLAFARQFGFSSEKAIVGKTDYDFEWTPELRDKYIADDQAVINTGQPKVNFEEQQRQPDGSMKTVLVNKVPIYDDRQNVIGILGTYLDITPLKQAQERALKAEAQTEAERQIKKAVASFAGTVAHDLRTPLTAINLIGEFLKTRMPMIVGAYEYAEGQGKIEEPLNPRQKEGLRTAGEVIQERVKTAQNYITLSLKSVKGAAQGESLLSQEDLVPCSIEKCVRKVIEDYPFKGDEKKKFHFICLKDFTFLGNEIFMVRVIENLIKNAYEQIHLKGKGEIYIQCNNHDHHPQLVVKDTAGDIAPSLIPHLFQGMQTTKTEGTGIGLSSAKEIMRLFGGDIKAQLVEGDCIAFILTFPSV
ncbi:MAG TPA: PAS domain-containing sensor histidine kinase [Coxiellaceae bacterium]|nr:PAS domain-containing sensor histidine kinase [Coxiellaceae bacterium]